jgi:hypothetical protein
VRSHVDERESSLSIALPSPFIFTPPRLDLRGDCIGQHLFPNLFRNKLARYISGVNLKLFANLSEF